MLGDLLSSSTLLAERHLQWLPSLNWQSTLILVCICAAAWLCVHSIWGKPIARPHIGLSVLRVLSICMLVAILLGPTLVDEQAGATTRPSMIYLIDGSQSMQLGQSQSRWDAALQFVNQADGDQSNSLSQDIQWFRFGHRLEPFQANSEGDQQIHLASKSSKIDAPNATDSRLGVALRQLLPQVKSDSTSGVVVLSDGRVRDTETVELLGKEFGDRKVPIHVVPLGENNGNGDLAIVSLAIPTGVRKYTENEVQVFLRSFGLNEKGTNVRLVRPSTAPNTEPTVISTVPITLSGGPQSASIPFRVEDRSEDLKVIVDAVPGELTTLNNQVSTRIEVDRSPIRVLYLQHKNSFSGVVQTVQQQLALAQSGGGDQTYLAIRNGLQTDNDIRCIAMTSTNGRLPENPSEGSTWNFTFPKTRNELFAFDCIIISDMAPVFMDDDHCQWLRQWVNERGGGLIVTGADSLNARVWKDKGLDQLLPIVFADQPDNSAEVAIEITTPQHPIFQIRQLERLNAQIVKSFPALNAALSGYKVKPNAEVFANSNGKPVFMAHRSGRGRVFLSTADLTERGFERLSQSWAAQAEQVVFKFWRNLVYWTAEGATTGRRRISAVPDKRFYRPGERISTQVTAYDASAAETTGYEVWAMFEPASLEDESLYTPLMWPDGLVRSSGETSPKIAWGEEIRLEKNPAGHGYSLDLDLSETTGSGDGRIQIQLTAYEPDANSSALNHGSQVDSTTVAIQVLSDPFEQQNPLPNHKFLENLASSSGGQVLDSPEKLTRLLKQRPITVGSPTVETAPAWNNFWLWMCLVCTLSLEWLARRLTGLA